MPLLLLYMTNLCLACKKLFKHAHVHMAHMTDDLQATVQWCLRRKKLQCFTAGVWPSADPHTAGSSPIVPSTIPGTEPAIPTAWTPANAANNACTSKALISSDLAAPADAPCNLQQQDDHSSGSTSQSSSSNVSDSSGNDSSSSSDNSSSSSSSSCNSDDEDGDQAHGPSRSTADPHLHFVQRGAVGGALVHAAADAEAGIQAAGDAQQGEAEAFLQTPADSIPADAADLQADPQAEAGALNAAMAQGVAAANAEGHAVGEAGAPALGAHAFGAAHPGKSNPHAAAADQALELDTVKAAADSSTANIVISASAPDVTVDNHGSEESGELAQLSEQALDQAQATDLLDAAGGQQTVSAPAQGMSIIVTV